MKNLIPTEKILISPNRQRRQFKPEEILDLGNSIVQVGLLHPIILRVVGEDYQLVAGERRLRAIQDLNALGQKFSFCGEPVPSGFVPFLSLGELTPIQAMEAELEENVRRVDLTWQEKAAATAGLMALRTAQAKDTSIPAPSIADISEEVRGSSAGSNYDATKREIILAKHLDNPLIQAAKTSKEAFGILKKQERREQNEAKGKALGTSILHSSMALRNENCFNWMADQEGGQFDVILTDPPYGMSANQMHGFGKGVETHHYDDSPLAFAELLTSFPTEAFRLAKPEAHLYIFCTIEGFFRWKVVLEGAGWHVFNTPLIWHKPTGFSTPWIEGGPQRRYEAILFAEKGGKKVNQIKGDVLTYEVETNIDRPAAKPSALFLDLLGRSTSPGDKVLDPFCGTGPIFSAAFEAKCFATGIEIDPAAYAIAAQRIKDLV